MKTFLAALSFILILPTVSSATEPPTENTEGGEAGLSTESQDATQTPVEGENAQESPKAKESKSNEAENSRSESGALTELTEEEKAQLEDSFGSFATAPSSGIISKILPDISLSLNTTAAWFSEENDTAQLGSHDAKTNGFNLNQVELNLSSNVDPYFKMNTIIIVGSHGFELEEAFATATALPWGLQMRAGYFFTRFGRLNSIHLHGWDFLDMAMINAKFFGGEGSRGLGGELSWLMPTPWYSEIVYSTTMVGNSTGINASFQIEQAHDDHGEEEAEGDSHDGHNHGSAISPSSYLDMLTTVAWKNFHEMGPNWGLKWGLSGQYGPYFGGHTEIYGADLYLRYKPIASQQKTAFSILAEVMLRRRVGEDSHDHDHDHEGEHGSDLLQDYGGNFELTWDFANRWSVGARYGFVTGLEEDPLQPSWTETEHKGSLQASFKPTEFSLIRLQGNVHTFAGGHDDHAGEHDHHDHHELSLGYSVMLGFAFTIGHHPPHLY